jgi:hypothetical protein
LIFEKVFGQAESRVENEAANGWVRFRKLDLEGQGKIRGNLSRRWLDFGCRLADDYTINTGPTKASIIEIHSD